MPPGVHLLIPLWFCALQAPASPPSAAEAGPALQRAAVLVQQGRLDEADQQARIALTDPTTKAGAYSVLGAIRYQQKRLDESATLLQKAIQLEPRLVGAHLNLAEVYSDQGKSAEATAMFRKVLELDPSNALARLALARDETAKGRYSQSWTLLQPVLDQIKTSPDGLIVLATDSLKLGHRQATASFAADWMRLNDVPQPWSVSFALVLIQGGAVQDGIDVLEHAKRSTPVSYELAFNLGSAYLVKGDSEKALAAYDQALSVQPDAVQALQQAAATAEQRNELERSLSYWIRLKKLQPDDPATLHAFGRVCLKMDLLEDAEPALSRAVSLKPADPAYQYTLAAAKVGKRQFDAAQTLLEGLVASASERGAAAVRARLGSVSRRTAS